MNSHKRTDYLTRAGVLALLSDDEIASVSNAESAERLKEGEEYLDLEHLDQGVRRAVAASADMGRVLPKGAIQEATWSKILKVAGAAPGSSHAAP